MPLAKAQGLVRINPFANRIRNCLGVLHRRGIWLIHNAPMPHKERRVEPQIEPNRERPLDKVCMQIMNIAARHRTPHNRKEPIVNDRTTGQRASILALHQRAQGRQALKPASHPVMARRPRAPRACGRSLT